MKKLLLLLIIPLLSFGQHYVSTYNVVKIANGKSVSVKDASKYIFYFDDLASGTVYVGKTKAYHDFDRSLPRWKYDVYKKSANAMGNITWYTNPDGIYCTYLIDLNSVQKSITEKRFNGKWKLMKKTIFYLE